MAKLTLTDFDFTNKKVIVRVDFNVPLGEDGTVADDTRIVLSLPTIKYLLDKGASKVILMSHLGRPKGKVVASLSLKPVGVRLSEILNCEVKTLSDCVGAQVKKEIEEGKEKIYLLENLRFHPQEEKGDEDFARSLASLADIYINDAFGSAHRCHASTAVIAKFLPSGLGFLMEKEVNFLSRALSPDKPYLVILGGAKVSDKIGVIKNLMKTADEFLIGGAFAYTFLKSKGEEIGSSRLEEDKLPLAREILEEAEKKKVKFILPQDHLAVKSLNTPETKKIFNVIPSGYMGVDIGPETIKIFKEELNKAKTILWNGPLGIFEKDDFCEGTKQISLHLAELKDVLVIVGGGDSAAAAKKFRVADKLSHISSGGGASLEFLEGKELPGIAAIKDK